MSLSIDENDQDDDPNGASNGTPLDERILQVVQQCAPTLTIRPARLASELGMSVNDACAELCALLSAVGGGEGGASFRFVKVESSVDVMEFTFPPDFARRARNQRRRDTVRHVLFDMVTAAVKILKVLTAFGLILSLLIVTILGMIGLVAAIVAMSRSGHRSHTTDLMRRLRSLFFTMRQLLWCYAIFGGAFEGQDPFLREVAMDLALCSSVCCGNPGSLWFWFRASQLRNRQRGWSRRYRGLGSGSEESIEGARLLNRGTWGRNEDDDAHSQSISDAPDNYRGLLSVAVEFLFGPTPFSPGPSECDTWKLRAAAIVQLSSREGISGVSLPELAPYADYPPRSLNQGVAASTINIIAHFNGVPVPSLAASTQDSAEQTSRFIFPELMAESQTIPRYDESPDLDDGTFEFLLYAPDVAVVRPPSSDIPSFLKQHRYVLTRLQRQQFLHCVILGLLNFVGVLWVGQSLQPGGVLDMSSMGASAIRGVLQNGLMPMLRFYSILFFVLPGGRLILILVLNALRERRNQKRVDLAQALKQPMSST